MKHMTLNKSGKNWQLVLLVQQHRISDNANYNLNNLQLAISLF